MAKIIDFGMSVLEGTELNKLCGTPGYIPNEVWEKRGWTPKGDVWALGVTVANMLSRDTTFSPLSGGMMDGIYDRSCSDINDCKRRARTHDATSDVATSNWVSTNAELRKHLYPLLVQCVKRDPDARPLPADVLRALEAGFPELRPAAAASILSHGISFLRMQRNRQQQASSVLHVELSADRDLGVETMCDVLQGHLMVNKVEADSWVENCLNPKLETKLGQGIGPGARITDINIKEQSSQPVVDHAAPTKPFAPPPRITERSTASCAGADCSMEQTCSGLERLSLEESPSPTSSSGVVAKNPFDSDNEDIDEVEHALSSKSSVIDVPQTPMEKCERLVAALGARGAAKKTITFQMADLSPVFVVGPAAAGGKRAAEDVLRKAEDLLVTEGGQAAPATGGRGRSGRGRFMSTGSSTSRKFLFEDLDSKTDEEIKRWAARDGEFSDSLGQAQRDHQILIVLMSAGQWALLSEALQADDLDSKILERARVIRSLFVHNDEETENEKTQFDELQKWVRVHMRDEGIVEFINRGSSVEEQAENIKTWFKGQYPGLVAVPAGK